MRLHVRHNVTHRPDSAFQVNGESGLAEIMAKIEVHGFLVLCVTPAITMHVGCFAA
jgi:hypothetical protein